MKRLHLQSADVAVQRQEREYLARLAGATGGGEIEIFDAPR